jgi:acetolactate synthase-1/2/3 large subunit
LRVADYIAALVAAHGVRDFFTVTGGGAMHLNDALSRNKTLHGICLHHEQACAMAAEAYCRLSGRLALLNVTTGPGGINALNGVHGAWTDSIGMLVISGQVKQETMASSYDLPLRQLGDQEADIVAMVRGITKFATVLRDKQETRYVVEKAIHLARTGRPGPVWIDVPMDIQGAQIEPETLRGFTPEPEPALPEVAAVAALLRGAKCPVIMPGTGVRISGAYDDFLRLVALTKFPVATAFNAHDVLPEDHPAYVGRPGTVGDRAGNFAVQNADVVLILGCRLNIRQISYNWENFAPDAVKIMVDIDPAELTKPTLEIETPISHQARRKPLIWHGARSAAAATPCCNLNMRMIHAASTRMFLPTSCSTLWARMMWLSPPTPQLASPPFRRRNLKPGKGCSQTQAPPLWDMICPRPLALLTPGRASGSSVWPGMVAS